MKELHRTPLSHRNVRGSPGPPERSICLEPRSRLHCGSDLEYRVRYRSLAE